MKDKECGCGANDFNNKGKCSYCGIFGKITTKEVKPIKKKKKMSMNNSTIKADNTIITGHNNDIYGDNNVIIGNNNDVWGENITIKGHNNDVYGSVVLIDGNNNDVH